MGLGRRRHRPARNPLQQPFHPTSIWNTPIGAGATYVNVGMPGYGAVNTNNWTPMPDIDYERIVLAPSAPQVQIQYSSTGWNFGGGGTRCTVTGGNVNGLPLTVPVPATFAISGTDPGNDSAAFLLADARTVALSQPLAICTAGGNGTSLNAFPNIDLYGDGSYGAHGGSNLATLGGSIRLGELRPGQTGMTHAIKIDVNATYCFAQQSSYANAYRWPATAADSDWASYGSNAPSMYAGMQMGALMAIPASVNLSTLGLASAPGMQLAWTLQNYGAYIVDSAVGTIGALGDQIGYVLCIEAGSSGSVADQVLADWGYPIVGRIRDNTPWTNDVQTCMSNLQLVDSNTASAPGGSTTPRRLPAAGIGAGVFSVFGNANTQTAVSGTGTSLSLSPNGLGALYLIGVVAQSNTVWCTSVSGGNCTWQQIGSKFTGTNTAYTITLFAGTATAPGTATATLTFNGATPTIHWAGQQFFAPGAGWAVDATGTVDVSSSAALPSVTPTHGAGELYFSYCWLNGSATPGSTSGYAYQKDTGGNSLVYDLSCTSGAQSPTFGATNTATMGMGALLYAL